MFRFDIKKIILLAVLYIIFFTSPFSIWSQNLEIHYINVQQGQSVLIIGPDGTTVLLDGGAEFKGTNEVVPYLLNLGITTAQALDYIIASHRDADHFMGLTEVINFGYDGLNVYDNGSDKYNTFIQDFLDAAAGTTAAGVSTMTLGQVINLGNGAIATCVAVNGSVIGEGAIPNGTDNENDRSICLLIQYGDFDYLVTGDLGGGADDFDCTGRSTSQINMETPLVQAIMPGGSSPLLTQYGVELAHVSHHGSESSTNSDYMNGLSPGVACISVGAGQSAGWDYPRINVVNVLLALAPCITVPAALVLQTEEGNPTGSLTSYAGYSVGDIVITTAGVNSYAVSASGAVSQGTDERAAAGLPVTYSFDEIIGSDYPPVLFNICSENVVENSADIAWSTNENATSTVKYGTVSGNYPSTVDESTQVLTHSLNLIGLTMATTYYYIVESTDVSTNTTMSTEYSFTTTGTPIPEIVFSEIFYDTPGTDPIEEWIELYNTTANTVNLEGWRIIDNNGTGWTFTFPAGETIAPGTHYTVAMNSGGFTALYGYEADLYGSLPFLNNSGDALILYDNSNNEIDAVAWEGGASAGIPASWGSTSNPWASTGSTIVRTDPTVDTDTYADWGTAAGNGNPQTQSVPVIDIVFSEVFYDTPGTDLVEEWIELYNNSATTVDLGGCQIIDNNGAGFTYTFPAGTTINAGTHFTIAMNSGGFTAIYGYEADLYGSLPFLNNSGDALILYDNSNNEIDAVAWEGGASAGIPAGWGSTSNPWASTGSSIVRTDPAVDTDTYIDWGTAAGNGNPQTQATGVPDTTPTVTTTIVSSITSTSASSGGNVSDDGGAAVTARGVCWGTSPNPDTSGSITSDGSGTGAFASSMTGLAPGTTYHVRAYATNSEGTAYGSDLTFTTDAVLPAVTTTAVSSITGTSASSGGNVSDDGGAAVTARGVCWGTSPNPDTSGSITSDGSGTGAFASSMTGLAPGTTYHVRAYATNSEGTAYGSDLTFTTNVVAPTVTTVVVSSITGISASSGGNVSDDGGAAVTARGVCWGTSPNPDTSGSITSDGSGTGAFASSMTGLAPGTTYHVRAYATNSEGTAYGRVLSFRTLDNPTISGRVSANGIGLTGVVLGFSNNGGTVQTNQNGEYRQTVSYGWSGTVTPSKWGYTLVPTNRPYQNVQSDQVNQDYAALTVNIALQAQRKREQAWIVRRDYGEITIQVDNPGNVSISRYILYRRVNNGGYSVVTEISGSALQNGGYQFKDMFLDNDKSYTYRITALDVNGMVMAESVEQTI